jgi:hypothetical protein
MKSPNRSPELQRNCNAGVLAREHPTGQEGGAMNDESEGENVDGQE